MSIRCAICKLTLNFKFEAGTSRGILKNKDSWFLKIWDEIMPEVYGLGEIAPLKGLSKDFSLISDTFLAQFTQTVNAGKFNIDTLFTEMTFLTENRPSLRFGLETAILDLINGGSRIIYDNQFTKKQKGIEINGLIWMGSPEFMNSQIQRKLKEGYTTLKMKIGAVDLDEEIKLLTEVRRNFDKNKLTLRVDANGAFTKNEAIEVMKLLAALDVHSIEQPITAGNWDEMAELCSDSEIAIALDEELINIESDKKKLLLESLKPHYIILKPTLLGGFSACDDWISAAESLKIGWWITSALESNIGLNAICQYTANKNNSLPQGLGTGQLYHNNITSPLQIESGHIYLRNDLQWDLSNLDFTN